MGVSTIYLEAGMRLVSAGMNSEGELLFVVRPRLSSEFAQEYQLVHFDGGMVAKTIKKIVER